MKLSTKCRYGLRALIHIAREYGGNPVKRKDISKAEGISEGYLENLLVKARSSGMVTATRGANGGYRLSRPPGEITVLEIVEALEGSVAPVDCLISRDFCKRSPNCVTHEVWNRVKQAVEGILSDTTLKDLAEEMDELEK